MADKKISALTSASTPLAGTEVLPIVQSGSTVKVSVADLTAGRSVTMSKVTASGSGELAKLETSGNITAGGLNYLRFYDSVGARGYVGYVGTGSLQITGSADVELQPASGSNVLLTGANIVVGTSGKGIDFSATAGTGTSELLDDYEVGTWTPTQGGGLTVVGTFSSGGNYTKIGNIVYLQGYVAGSTSVSFSAGGATICSGLPFSANTANPLQVGLGINSNNTTSAPCFAYGSLGILSAGTYAATAEYHFSVFYRI